MPSMELVLAEGSDKETADILVSPSSAVSSCEVLTKWADLDIDGAAVLARQLANPENDAGQRYPLDPKVFDALVLPPCKKSGVDKGVQALAGFARKQGIRGVGKGIEKAAKDFNEHIESMAQSCKHPLPDTVEYPYCCGSLCARKYRGQCQLTKAHLMAFFSGGLKTYAPKQKAANISAADVMIVCRPRDPVSGACSSDDPQIYNVAEAVDRAGPLEDSLAPTRGLVIGAL